MAYFQSAAGPGFNEHIIQIAKDTTGFNGTSTSSATYITKTINITDGNDVCIFIDGGMRKSSAPTGGHIRCYIEGGSLGAGASGQQVRGQIGYGNDGTSENSVCTSFVDTTPGSGDVTFGLYVVPVSGATAVYKLDMILMEMQGTVS